MKLADNTNPHTATQTHLPKDFFEVKPDEVRLSSRRLGWGPLNFERRETEPAENCLPNGSRRVMSISEITGIQDEVVAMQEMYRFEPALKNGREGWVNTGCQPKTPKLRRFRNESMFIFGPSNV